MTGWAGACHVLVGGFGYALGRIAEVILVTVKGRGGAREAEAEARMLRARKIEIDD